MTAASSKEDLMPRQPSININSVSIVVPVELPPGKRGSVEDDPHVALEVHANDVRVWDSATHTDCGAVYSFRDDVDPRLFAGRDRLPDIPHFDVVYRYLVEQYAANRTNPLGKHLAPAVEAMDAAIAERRGTSVYFASSANRIKIGWSGQVATRLAQLQTGNPDPVRLLATMPGGRALERRLHERFADARLAGEWFAATPELMAYIELTRHDQDHDRTA